MKNKSSASRFGKKAPQALGARTLTSRLFLQALEPRVLLDAAAAKTAHEAAHAVPDVPPAAETQAHAELIAALGAVEQHKSTPAMPAAQHTDVYFIDRTVDQADVLAKSLPA
ncbi:MAG: LEPR-XLL domain-containing protein, partial [Achromobacter piechaudii]